MDHADGIAVGANVVGWSLSDPWMPPLPFKLDQDRRRHIPKQERKVTNSAAYDAALRQHGSLTVCFTDEAVAAWEVAAWAAEPRTTQGGQRWHSGIM